MASIDIRPGGRYRARWRESPGGPQKSRTFGRKAEAERFLVDVQHRLLTDTYTPPTAGPDRPQGVRLGVAGPALMGAVDARPNRTGATAPHPAGVRSNAARQRATLPGGGVGQGAARRSLQRPHGPRDAIEHAQRRHRRRAHRSEPGQGARLARAEVAAFVPLAPDEVRSVTAHTAEHIRAAVVVAAGMGLRQGELFGLTVDRIDFMRSELRVDRELWTPPAGKPVLKTPKSRNSYRTVALSSLIVNALAAHRRAFGPGEDGLVFHIRGRAVARSMASKYIRTAPAAQLGGHGWRDLRHHHASVLLSAGVSPALVAERLGHDVKTLPATYAHVIRIDDDRVRPIVDGSLGVSAEDWLRTAAVS